MACSTDRYGATYVVAPSLGPLDCQTADFTDIQAAIDASPPAGKIFVKAGTYNISKTIQIARSNIHIQGEGMGITNIVADATMTASPALVVHNVHSGTPLPLVADAQAGAMVVTVSPADAATLSAGDYILLFSNRPVDSEDTAKCAGEVKQVTAVDASSGVITADDQVYDDYSLTDSAAIAKITVLRDLTLSDLSVTTLAPLYTVHAGLTQFRFVDNLQVERIEVHDAYNSGIDLVSVINSRISDCYLHHISDVTPPAHTHYGVVVGAASRCVSVSGCRFNHTRHAVTTGGSGGGLLSGVQRSIVVSHCTSMAADTAHFDTHDPAENVSFVGCAAIGGVPAPLPAPQEVLGFQMRGANGSIVGCSVSGAIGKGIMIFHGAAPNRQGSDGATITSNMIAGVKSVAGSPPSLGVGIFLDGTGTSRHSITGNVIKQCEGSAIVGSGGNNQVVIAGNIIDQSNSVVTGASISFHNGEGITICANQILNNQTGSPIQMAGTSAGWQIAHNTFQGNQSNTPVSLNADATLANNSGYNPVGLINGPWRSSGDLTNQGGGDPNPVSGQTYMVRQSPKTIVIAAGVVSDIKINGVATGLPAGVFKLGIGETIAVAYTSVPSSTVFAE